MLPAFRYGMQNHPFKIDAIAILPDHLHCIWTLPENDADFSTQPIKDAIALVVKTPQMY
jgi:REP element-mobilizing transposase RayT